MTATLVSDSAYNALCGEPMVRAVCARLYELMDILPEAKACRDVHPPSLTRAEEKLYEFLTGWLGGADEALPDSFRSMSKQMRQSFVGMAADLEARNVAGYDAKRLQALDTCIGCHESYRFSEN